MTAEAAEMVEESFGRIILHTIGCIYTLQSAMYLGNFFEAQAAKMRQSVCVLGGCELWVVCAVMVGVVSCSAVGV